LDTPSYNLTRVLNFIHSEELHDIPVVAAFLCLLMTAYETAYPH